MVEIPTFECNPGCHACCGIPLSTLAALKAGTMVAVAAPVMVMACTIDVGIGEDPDETCVLDEGRSDLCIYAKDGMKREECECWKLVQRGHQGLALSLSPAAWHWLNQNLAAVEALAAGTWKAMPVELTPHMNGALYASIAANGKRDTETHWEALLRAAPETPEN